MLFRVYSKHPHIEIERDAVGHMDQNEQLVMFSMGQKGYYIHDKTTGKLVGRLQPKHCKNTYHIHHPKHPQSVYLTADRSTSSSSISNDLCSLSAARRDMLTPLYVSNGSIVHGPEGHPINLEEDEWGVDTPLNLLLHSLRTKIPYVIRIGPRLPHDLPRVDIT